MKNFIILFLVLLSSHLVAQSDKGIGVIFFLQSAPTLDNPKSDTVFIYSKPSVGSGVVDKFMFNAQDRFKQLEKTKFEFSCSIEFDNETFGLPVVQAMTSKGWYKVIYDKNKPPGFVKQCKSKLKFVTWKELLPQKFLFFESDDNIQFFDKPNGTIQKFELARAEHRKYDYTMKPLRVEGNWMQIEIVTPSDNCSVPEIMIKGIFWVRYLDEHGRPLVWYFTRGC
jgi:hypothetical protein